MAQRVIVHVGTPKSGTTYLQGLLWKNREHLAEVGVQLPLERRRDHNQASGDISGNVSRVLPGVEPTTWDQMVTGIEACAGTAVISEEMLAGLDEAGRTRMVETVGADKLHIVVTGRDAIRQLPSVWQQTLKHGLFEPLEDYAATVAAGNHAYWPRQQDLRRILGRWCEHLPPQQVHLVTVPPSGADPRLLWQRFAQVLEIDPEGFDAPDEKANETLDSVQAEVLRRVNELLRGRLPFPEPYVPVVRLTMFPALAQHTGGHRITIPEAQVDWALDYGQDAIEKIRGLGIDVVGDLDDLAGKRPKPVTGDEVPPEVYTEIVLETLADMAVAHADKAQQVIELRTRFQTVRSKLERVRGRNARLRNKVAALEAAAEEQGGGLRRRLRRS